MSDLASNPSGWCLINRLDSKMIPIWDLPKVKDKEMLKEPISLVCDRWKNI